MTELANYSIETDSTVLLSFRDGKRLRVRLDQVQKYVSPLDAERIRAATRLRQDFIRQHMPKAVFAMAAGMLGLVVAGNQVMAGLWRPKPEPAPERTEIVRSINAPATESTASTGPMLAAPESTVTPAPAVRTAGRTTQTIALKRQRQTSPQALLPSAKVSLPVTLPLSTPLPDLLDDVLPLPSPTPSPSASPAPSVSPSPSTPPAGEVLGESTGPNDEPEITPQPQTQ